jgi:hypothetical protein
VNSFFILKRDGKTHEQEETEGVVEWGGITACLAKSLADLESTGSQDDSESEPETTVGRESGGTKGVTDGHFPVDALATPVRIKPNRGCEVCETWTGHNGNYGYIPHAGEQLDKTTVAERQGDDYVGRRDIPCAHVDKTQDESSEGESAQAEGGGIGELAALDRLVQTGLELTTEGGQGGLCGVDVGERSVSEAGGSACDLVLFSGHLGLHGSAVGGGAGVLILDAVGAVNCFGGRHFA